MKRLMKWNGDDWVHTDYSGEEVCEGEDCISLVDDYPGLSLNSFTWKREVWEALAEHIFSEKKRREEEAKPKRWYVEADSNGRRVLMLAADQQSPSEIHNLNGSRLTFYVVAPSEWEAKDKADKFFALYREVSSLTKKLSMPSTDRLTTYPALKECLRTARTMSANESCFERYMPTEANWDLDEYKRRKGLTDD